MRGLILRGDARNPQLFRPLWPLRAIGQKDAKYCEREKRPYHTNSTWIQSQKPGSARQHRHFITQPPLPTRRRSGLHSVSVRTASTASAPATGDVTSGDLASLDATLDTYQNGAEPESDEDAKKAEEEALAILAEGQPGRVMAAFLNPRYRAIFATLPPAMYLEALRLVSRTYFLSPYKEIQLEPTAYGSWSQKAKHLRYISRRFYHFLRKIVDARHSVGGYLGMAEYTHLLDCAREMGAAAVAEWIWKSMEENGVLPSVQCYNYYMEAKNWDQAYFHKENHHIRAIRAFYRRRRQRSPNPGFKGYSTGHGGVRDQVAILLREMTGRGLEPDTGTHTQRLIAESREGNVRRIMALLKSTWNIDVEVLAENPSQHPPVTPYPRSSPLYPTPELLVAIIHAFASNNEFAAALRTADFVSINYKIPMPPKAWEELFQWSYVLTVQRYRSKKAQEENPPVGEIPLMGALHTYFTMTSEPYGVVPSFSSIHRAVKLRTFPYPWAIFQEDTLNDMRSARDRLFETVSKRNSLKLELDALLPKQPVWGTPRDPSFRPISAAFVRLRQWTYLIPKIAYDGLYWQKFYEYQMEQMRAIREDTYVRQMVARVLQVRGWIDPRLDWEERGKHPSWDIVGIPKDHDETSHVIAEEWSRRGIPNFIAEWHEFLPKPLRYKIPTGEVEFSPRSVWPGGKYQSMADPMRRIPEGYKGVLVRPRDYRPFLVKYHISAPSSSPSNWTDVQD